MIRLFIKMTLLIVLVQFKNNLYSQELKYYHKLPDSVIKIIEKKYTFNCNNNLLENKETIISTIENSKIKVQEKEIKTPPLKTIITYNYINNTIYSEIQKVISEFGYTENKFIYAYDTINNSQIIKKGIEDAPKDVVQKKYFKNYKALEKIEYYENYGNITDIYTEYYKNNVLKKTKSVKITTDEKIVEKEIYYYDKLNYLKKRTLVSRKINKLKNEKYFIKKTITYTNYAISNGLRIQVQNEGITNNIIYLNVQEIAFKNNNKIGQETDKIILEFCKKNLQKQKPQ